jgi:hypothetical protein
MVDELLVSRLKRLMITEANLRVKIEMNGWPGTRVANKELLLQVLIAFNLMLWIHVVAAIAFATMIELWKLLQPKTHLYWYREEFAGMAQDFIVAYIPFRIEHPELVPPEAQELFETLLATSKSKWYLRWSKTYRLLHPKGKHK